MGLLHPGCLVGMVTGGFELKNLAEELVVIKMGQICIREHFNSFSVSEGLLQSLGTVRL